MLIDTTQGPKNAEEQSAAAQLENVFSDFGGEEGKAGTHRSGAEGGTSMA